MACAISLASAAQISAQQSAWTIGPFTRPAPGNPVITPNPASTFDDPIRHAPVHWEALHTFNPAAIVRKGKVYVLYRAEDNSGAMEIGMHTSRLGMARRAATAFISRAAQSRFSTRQRMRRKNANGRAAWRTRVSSNRKMARMC